MNRGEPQDVYDTNVALADALAQAVAASGNRPHVIFSSSTQRDQKNLYGQSKRQCEECFERLVGNGVASVTNLIIPNVYGPGCRPFYNSVVATFCHQLAHGETPQLMQDREVEFICVTELVEEIWTTIKQRPTGFQTLRILGPARWTVSRLLSLLRRFRDDFFQTGVIPDLSDPLVASLYATFLSYIELDDHRHRPHVHSDPRGSLFEIIKLANGGQVFFSTTKPGVIRGDHYHTRKIEWFCVLRGEAMISLRRVGQDSVLEFRVSGASPEFISIPVFHTHNIQNVGEDELLTMFWCNEIFSTDDPDTFYEKVA